MQRPTPHPRCYEIVAQISKTKGLDGQLVALEGGGLSVLRPELEVWIVPPALEGVRHTSVIEVQESKHKSGVLIKLQGVDDRTQAENLVGRYLLARSEDALPYSSNGQARKVVESTRSVESINRNTESVNCNAKSGNCNAESQPYHSEHPPCQSEHPPCHSEHPPCHSERSEESSPSDTTAPHNTHPLERSNLVFTDTSYGDLGTLTEVKAGPAYDIWVIEGPHGVLEIPAVDAYITEESEGTITLTLPAGFIEITSIHREGDNRHED